jgi:hypothetical protein
MRIIEGGLRVAASDVANFLACQQLTQLDLRAAQGTLRPPAACSRNITAADASMAAGPRAGR